MRLSVSIRWFAIPVLVASAAVGVTYASSSDNPAATPESPAIGEGPGDRPLKGPELERWFFQRWHHPYGRTLPRAQLNGIWKDIKALPAEKDTEAVSSWELVGPVAQIVSGGAKNTGRILDIEQRGDYVWLAAATGGLWRCWLNVFCSPLTDRLTSLATGSFAVHPTDMDTVLVGTGEPAGASGTGIYQTTNNGQTWNHRQLPVPDPSGVFRIRYAPNGTTVHAATTAGYFRSEDGGVHWTSPPLAGWVSDLALHPTFDNIVYATVWGNGLFKSLDWGQTWNPVTGSGLPTSSMGRGAIAIAPSDPNFMYVAWADSNGRLLGVFRSTTAGAAWTDVSPPTNYFGRQGGYDNVITVSPVDRDTVLVGGVTLHKSTGGGVGGNWSQMSSPHLHVDYHAFAWDSTNRLWAGHDGGISFSDDAGSTWSSATNVVPITQYYRIHTGLVDDQVIAGASQDNGISVTNDGGNTWYQRQTGDGAGITIDPNFPNRMWSTVGVYPDGPWSFQRFRSTDGGGSWTAVNNGIDPGATWLPKIRNDQVAPVYVYTGFINHIYESSDFGDTWNKLNPTAFAHPVSNLAVSRYESPKAVIYAVLDTVTQGQRLWVYDDDGWYARDTGFPAGEALRSVFAHPHNKNIAFALVNGLSAPGQKVFRTVDRGQSWTNITGNLPNVPLGGIVEHPDNSALLYLGTEMGAFRSSDGGQHWQVWNAGLPDAAIITELWYQDLRATSGGFHVVAGTYGRSIWKRETTGTDACRPVHELSCSETISASTLDPEATNVVDTYACSPYYYPSQEYATSLQLSTTSQVTVTLDQMSQDLDIMVLEEGASSCDPETCIASSLNSGTTPEEVVFTAVAGTTYDFVVDGITAQEGSFRLAVACDASTSHIFSDGFESGDTTAWTLASP